MVHERQIGQSAPIGIRMTEDHREERPGPEIGIRDVRTKDSRVQKLDDRAEDDRGPSTVTAATAVRLRESRPRMMEVRDAKK